MPPKRTPEPKRPKDKTPKSKGKPRIIKPTPECVQSQFVWPSVHVKMKPPEYVLISKRRYLGPLKSYGLENSIFELPTKKYILEHV